MTSHLTGESPPGRIARARAALRRVTLVQWVLVTMLGVGGLAFLRAFAGGEGVAVQRLAWGALAWTFPLLWDVTAVIGSTLWIAAPRRTAAFRWGVFLNLTATVVSGLATGSQAFTLARDTLPGGWPWPAFASGAAVPLLYSILTWAAASARVALAPKEQPWPGDSTPSTASAEGTAGASSEPPTLAEPEPAPLPASSPTPSSLPALETSPSEAPAPSPASSTPTPTLAPPFPSPGTPRPMATAPSPDITASAPTPTEALDSPSGPGTTPAASSGPSAETDGRPSSTPDERRAWAVAELLRRAEAPNASELRPRDIDREFGMKDGWRVLAAAQRQVQQSTEPVPATAGAET